VKVSLIVAVYKDIEALSLIVDSLKTQTYKNFELVVAEDGKSIEVKNYIKTLKKLNFKTIHTTQEDKYIRKSASQNNAIRASTGQYLIFIDGDCVLYSTFIEYHVALAQKGYFVGGRRVNLGPKYSTMLRKNIITPQELENKFLLKFFDISKDASENHTEDGFTISPISFIYKYFLKNRKK